MKKLLIRGGLALLGMAITLTWWTIRPDGHKVQQSSSIPARVGAGGNTMEISVEGAGAATMRVGFEDLSKPAGSQEVLDSWEKVPAGAHNWSIDVPSGLGGYVEFEADAPKVGDKLTMQIRMNGELVADQGETLDSPLEPNYAFALQEHFDDYSKARQELSGAASGIGQ
jgi:hypothetical protein